MLIIREFFLYNTRKCEDVCILPSMHENLGNKWRFITK